MKKVVFFVVMVFFAIQINAQINPDTSIVNEVLKNRQNKNLPTVIEMTFEQVLAQKKRDTEIWSIISKSKEVNQEKAGITNPSKIFPGQILTFCFKDGTVHAVVVEKGDNQWTIVREISDMENIHGPVINYPKPDSISKKAVVPEKIVLEKKTSILEWISNLPWWAWLLMGIGMIFIIGTIVHNENEKRNVDPITAGPPQVPGGVTDVSAHSRINAIAQSRFPGARLNIKNIRRGHLSGKGTVSYADGTKPKKINLKNVAAYAGEITINGTDEHTIYFLQGCGNDTAVSHMSGDELVFTPDVVINPDGSESSIPVVPEEVPVIETVTENQPTVPTPIPVPGSEFHQHVEKGMETVKGFLDGNDAKHRVSLKITHDSFEVVIENKYDQKKSTGPQASIEK